jgi:molybdopterin synthase catalytic subunit
VTGIDIKISDDALDVNSALHFVTVDGAGGTCVFVGTVRNKTQERQVVQLEFEAYVPMAISEMRKIGEHAMQHWPVIKISMHHRLGALNVGDVPVVIAVSAAHRGAAFEACQYCIDTLKQTVPIWKKEVFVDGEAWVSAHP